VQFAACADALMVTLRNITGTLLWSATFDYRGLFDALLAGSPEKQIYPGGARGRWARLGEAGTGLLPLLFVRVSSWLLRRAYETA